MKTVHVVIDRPRLDPLAWIHRREARGMRGAGHEVFLTTELTGEAPLLRLSDPAMRVMVARLEGKPYAGPGVELTGAEHPADATCEITHPLFQAGNLPWRKDVLPPERIRLPLREIDAQRAMPASVDWAARVDLIEEAGTGRLVFLECDAAPLVGAGSAWARSFAAAGVDRARQLEWLLGR